MTMYNPVDGRLDDCHASYLGARASGGFALVGSLASRLGAR